MSNKKWNSNVISGAAFTIMMAVITAFLINSRSSTAQTESDKIQVPSAYVEVTQQHVVPSPSPKMKEIKRIKVKDPSRMLTLYGEVNSSVLEISNKIIELNRVSSEPIYLLINSPGGSVFDGNLLLSAIQASKAPVHTVCVGICASMAAITLEYGKTRLALDRTIVMFHDAAGALQGKVEGMNSMLQFIRRDLERTDRYIVSRSKLSYDQFQLYVNQDLWLSAEDALEFGLIDAIVTLDQPIPALSPETFGRMIKQYPILQQMR